MLAWRIRFFLCMRVSSIISSFRIFWLTSENRNKPVLAAWVYAVGHSFCTCAFFRCADEACGRREPERRQSGALSVWTMGDCVWWRMDWSWRRGGVPTVRIQVCMYNFQFGEMGAFYGFNNFSLNRFTTGELYICQKEVKNPNYLNMFSFLQKEAETTWDHQCWTFLASEWKRWEVNLL